MPVLSEVEGDGNLSVHKSLINMIGKSQFHIPVTGFLLPGRNDELRVNSSPHNENYRSLREQSPAMVYYAL